MARPGCASDDDMAGTVRWRRPAGNFAGWVDTSAAKQEADLSFGSVRRMLENAAGVQELFTRAGA